MGNQPVQAYLQLMARKKCDCAPTIRAELNYLAGWVVASSMATGGPGSYAKNSELNPKSPPWDDVRYTSVFGRKADIAF